MSFVWESDRCASFRWKADALLVPLGAARAAQGELRGTLAHLGPNDRLRADLEARTEEALETAAIEGEALSPVAIRSSVARCSDIDLDAPGVAEARADGLVDMAMDAAVALPSR